VTADSPVKLLGGLMVPPSCSQGKISLAASRLPYLQPQQG
jgi:hypothetical protein